MPRFYFREGELPKRLVELMILIMIFILQVDLGVAVQKACEDVAQPLKFLYRLDISIKEKIEAIARSYGASGVEYSEQVASAPLLVQVKYCLIKSLKFE